MALPLPRVVADVGPGGPLVTAMGGMNSLANDMLLRKINAVKAKYAPLTTQAEAASKLAYANLMGPQFLAKLMGNEGALGNLSEDQKRNILSKVYGAGTGQGTGNSIFGQMQNENMGLGEKTGNALSDFFANHLKSIFGGGQQPQQQTNPMASMPGMGAPAQNPFAPQQPSMPQQAQPGMAQGQPKRPIGGVTLEGEQWYDKDGNPVYEQEGGEGTTLEPELTKERTAERQRTYAENTGAYKGTVKEGEDLGKHRAEAINDIGQQQMQLSQTGANLDRLIEDINDPKFMSLRNDIPFFQDTQLRALSKIGTPEQQEMIGNFIADAKSFAGSTVNSFKGATMKREFDYADQLKPTENDTVASARGKIIALKSLKEIAEQKNNIILDLMQDQHMNLGDAVKTANKMVDTKAIDKQVRKLTEPTVTIRNPKTGQKRTVSLSEARKLGVPNV